jgi:hypothetical protein
MCILAVLELKLIFVTIAGLAPPRPAASLPRRGDQGESWKP